MEKWQSGNFISNFCSSGSKKQAERDKNEHDGKSKTQLDALSRRRGAKNLLLLPRSSERRLAKAAQRPSAALLGVFPLGTSYTSRAATAALEKSSVGFLFPPTAHGTCALRSSCGGEAGIKTAASQEGGGESGDQRSSTSISMTPVVPSSAGTHPSG